MYKYKYQFFNENLMRESFLTYLSIIFFSVCVIFGIFESIILPIGDLVSLKEHTMVENNMLAFKIDSLKELSRHQVALLESLDETNQKVFEESIKTQELLAKSNEQGAKIENSSYNITVATAIAFLLYLKVMC